MMVEVFETKLTQARSDCDLVRCLSLLCSVEVMLLLDDGNGKGLYIFDTGRYTRLKADNG